MKAIRTKYYGPTNNRGSRIRAWDSDGNSVTVPYDDIHGSSDMHDIAAIALCGKMNWRGELVAGGLGKDGNVYVFVTPETIKIG